MRWYLNSIESHQQSVADVIRTMLLHTPNKHAVHACCLQPGARCLLAWVCIALKPLTLTKSGLKERALLMEKARAEKVSCDFGDRNGTVSVSLCPFLLVLLLFLVCLFPFLGYCTWQTTGALSFCVVCIGSKDNQYWYIGYVSTATDNKKTSTNPPASPVLQVRTPSSQPPTPRRSIFRRISTLFRKRRREAQDIQVDTLANRSPNVREEEHVRDKLSAQ